MRHLLLTFIFATSNVALAQQEAKVDVSAAMSRGAVVCSTHMNYTVEGKVLDDKEKTPGIKFTNSHESNLYKLVRKSIAADGKITVYGILVESSNPTKLKSRVKMTDDLFQGKEYFQTAKFEDNSESIITRCTNFRDIAVLIPDLPIK